MSNDKHPYCRAVQNVLVKYRGFDPVDRDGELGLVLQGTAMTLSDMTMEQLLELQRRVGDDPASRNTVEGSPWIHTESARRRLHRITRAINDLMVESKRANGTLHWRSQAGWSGRKSNK